MDKYEELQEILDSHPSTAPKSDSFIEILKILFTPEEVAVACTMSYTPKSIGDISAASGLPENKTEELLESMANKAVIFSKNREGSNHYGLLPTIPGLFEFPFMKGGGTPMHDKLGKLWEEYHNEALGESFCGNPTPLMRIVPVAKSVITETRIHPYEEVAELINKSSCIALTECACRVSLHKCDKPKDVCLIFGAPGKFLVERGYAREISKNEGMNVLDRAEKAGLVHTSNNSKDKASVICNCCSCCCTILRGRTVHNHPHAFVHSRFQARIIEDECDNCGTCYEERCPVKAIDSSGELPLVSAEKCIGCGLCVSECPNEAIEFIKKEEEIDMPATIQELGINVSREKGRFEKFLKIMQR